MKTLRLKSECRMSKAEGRMVAGGRLGFVIRHSDFFRHSSFVIRHFLPLALFFAPRAAHACAVCFGNSDSKLSQGMLAGVLVLLFCVLSVLGGFVVLFVHLARRAAASAASENQSTESKA